MNQVKNELSAAVSEILIDEETLHGRIAELGAQVSDDYRGEDLLLIGVLKGAIFFMADLMRSIEIPCGSISWLSRATEPESTLPGSSGSSRISTFRSKVETCSSSKTSSIPD